MNGRQVETWSATHQKYPVQNPPHEWLPPSGSVQFHGSEHAANHVVQLPGDTRPLLFTGGIDVGCEFTQPFTRQAQLFLLPQLFGDIDADANDGRPTAIQQV